jgi:hypothetical protein
MPGVPKTDKFTEANEKGFQYCCPGSDLCPDGILIRIYGTEESDLSLQAHKESLIAHPVLEGGTVEHRDL